MSVPWRIRKACCCEVIKRLQHTGCSVVGGGKEHPSGTLMRLMGEVELVAGWHFDSLHVPCVLFDLGVKGREICTSALAANSSAKPLRERLNALTKVISGVGSRFA